MINRDTIDKILDAVRITDVVGEFVTLKRRGANYIACCPFHDEKTPSFSVSPSKGIFKCFGCGKGGDAVHFVMEHEHMTYPEALKWLAAKYHIEVVEKEETAEEAAQRLRSESMMLVNEFAAGFFSDCLTSTEEGKAVGMSYFRDFRGLSEETIRRFGLGYSPAKRDALASAAREKGFKNEFLTATGLCVEREDGRLSDRFYERVIFPICSLSGRVIAFGGRTLKTDKTVAKYVNSPESEIYVKRRSLYGIHLAKGEISKKDKCYLVEGYLDVISMHQSGITNVVASSGTSLTSEQIRLIRRFTNNITILYDGDAAGIKASLRGIDLILEEGMNVKVVLIPDGDDPDSYSRKHSLEEIRAFIDAHEQDFISFKTSLLIDEAGNDPRMRAGLINDITASIAVIPDAIARSLYAEQCAGQFGIRSELIFENIRKIRASALEKEQKEARRREAVQPQPAQPEPVQETKPLSDNEFLLTCEKEIGYYLVKFGSEQLRFPPGSPDYDENRPDFTISVADYIRHKMDEDGLRPVNSLCRKIYDEYFRIAGEHGTQTITHFLHHQDEAIAAETLGYVYDSHTITVKEFADSLPGEETQLSEVVPKLMYIYKLKVVEMMLRELQQQIENDRDNPDLIMRFTRITQARTYYSKMLRRLVP